MLHQRRPYGELMTFTRRHQWVACSSTFFALRTIMRVLELTVFSNSAKSMVQSAAEEVSVAPCLGGCSGTYLTVPPAISMLLIYLGSCNQTRHQLKHYRMH